MRGLAMAARLTSGLRRRESDSGPEKAHRWHAALVKVSGAAFIVVALVLSGCSSGAMPAQPAPQPQWSKAREALLAANTGRFRSVLVEHQCASITNGCEPLDVRVTETGSFSITPATIEFEHVVTRPDSKPFATSFRAFADGAGFLHYVDGSMGPCWSPMPLAGLLQGNGPPTPLGIKIMLASTPVEGGLGLVDGVLRSRAPAPLVLAHMAVPPPVADTFKGSTVPVDLHFSGAGDLTGFSAQGARVAAAIAHTEAGKGNLETMTVASNDLDFELSALGEPQHITKPDSALVNDVKHSGLHNCRADHG